MPRREKYSQNTDSDSSIDSTDSSCTDGVFNKKNNKICKRNKCDSSSESSKSRSENFDDKYCYYKKYLLEDPSLMLRGASTYANLWTTNHSQAVALNIPVIVDSNSAIKNVDYKNLGGDIYVRESGTYVLNYSIETDQPCQFGVFVNNKLAPFSVTGTNAGSGQLLFSGIFELCKNDHVTIRNHSSTVIGGIVTIIQFAGGSAVQANVQITLYKVAPLLDNVARMYDDDYSCNDKHKKLFHKLERKLLCDPELQITGNDAYGAFYSTTAQTINVEAATLFDLTTDILNLTHVAGSSDIIIQKSGIYHVKALIETTQAGQFAIFVNGTVNQGSVVGVNTGGSILTTRNIIELVKGDVINWKNHTSAVPVLSGQNPGGLQPAINVELSLIKIAPPSCANTKMEHKEYCDLPKKVREFKEYLLSNRKLQINGAKLIDLTASAQQTIGLGTPVIWKTLNKKNCISFIPGKPEIIIDREGEYEVVAMINTSQPDQFAFFVNGNLVKGTIAGKDSGGASLRVFYILNLCKCDKLTWVNYQSLVDPVVSSSNAGGTEVGTNATIHLIRLGNADLCNKGVYYKGK